MSAKIYRLTPEQQVILPQYLVKWRSIARSTDRINSQQAIDAIQAVYAAIDQPMPEIIFCKSPADVANALMGLMNRSVLDEMQEVGYSDDEKSKILDDHLGVSLQGHFNQLQRQLNQQLEPQLRWEVQLEIEEQLRQPVDQISYDWQVWEQLEQNPWLWQQLRDCIVTSSLITDTGWMDYAITVLNCDHDAKKWQALNAVAQYCGWILPYEKICIVCDRPSHLRVDRELRLHAEGEPALQFTDGFEIYAHQGVRLPESYGKCHPHQWRSDWLLDEANAELRRILLQGIGYGRVSQELHTIDLDNWHEYTLLEIDAELDEEPILLLKMTCPSTGFIHVTRVPPHVESAREAIQWVNWDIDPEEFAFQT
jgi:hypothetical protein